MGNEKDDGALLEEDQEQRKEIAVLQETPPAQLQYSIPTEDCQESLSIAEALRVRDALISLERSIIQAREEFEAEIAKALGGGR